MDHELTQNIDGNDMRMCLACMLTVQSRVQHHNTGIVPYIYLYMYMYQQMYVYIYIYRRHFAPFRLAYPFPLLTNLL